MSTLRTTRTHARFFDAQLVRHIYGLAALMSDNWDSRKEYVSQEIRDAGDARISALFAAIVLCDEGAPE